LTHANVAEVIRGARANLRGPESTQQVSARAAFDTEVAENFQGDTRRDEHPGRAAGIRFQTINSVAVVIILVLMIWKPGA